MVGPACAIVPPSTSLEAPSSVPAVEEGSEGFGYHAGLLSLRVRVEKVVLCAGILLFLAVIYTMSSQPLLAIGVIAAAVFLGYLLLVLTHRFR